MVWEQVGRKWAGKSREYTLKRDAKQLGRERDTLRHDVRRLEQRSHPERGQQIAVKNVNTREGGYLTFLVEPYRDQPKWAGKFIVC